MDEQLFFLINSNHTAFWDSMMYCISQKTVWIPFYLSVIYVILRNYSWKELAVVLLMIGCGMLVTDWGNAHLLRPWIGRLRPSNPDNPISSLVHIVNDRRGAGCGFPSAHSANIWLLTFVICYWLRNRLIQIHCHRADADCVLFCVRKLKKPLVLLKKFANSFVLHLFFCNFARKITV